MPFNRDLRARTLIRTWRQSVIAGALAAALALAGCAPAPKTSPRFEGSRALLAGEQSALLVAHPSELPAAPGELAAEAEPAAPKTMAPDVADTAAESDVTQIATAAWAPPDVPRRPYRPQIERWRPLVRALLIEAAEEGRLDGPAAGLDDDLVLAVIQQESAGDAEAMSWAGALGLMQVMPKTFAEMLLGDSSLAAQIDLPVFLDAASNVRAGIRYLALAMQSDEGNLYWSLAAYNAGIEAVNDWRAVGLYAVPPIGGYVETAYYAPTILRNYLRHRPGLELYVPPLMPDEHVAGAIDLLKAGGRW